MLKQNNKSQKGFSLIEVMTAAAVISGLGVAIYELQMSALATSQGSVTKQLVLQYSSDLIDNMFAQNTPSSTSTLSLIPGGILSYYVETAYSVAVSPNKNCSLDICSDSDWAKYNIYLWKNNLQTKTNIPATNVHAIICQDSKLSIPSATSPNCDGSGNLVLKVFWTAHLDTAESLQLGTSNYIMLRIPQR